MKKIFAPLVILIFLTANSIAAQAGEQARDFTQLYGCIQKLQQAGASSKPDSDLAFLKNDLFYILEKRTSALYLFTPYFAGNADLAHNIAEEIKRTLDANKIDSNPFPFTPCCQEGFSYNIRIPYSPEDLSEQKGYFYLTINDATPIMYDEVYWDKGAHKMRVVRHDTPFMKVGPHNVSVVGLSRFLAGAPQKMPDFTNYKPEQVENGITITSVSGQIDKGVEYQPLDVEDRLWDSNAQNNFTAEARDLLVSIIQYGLRNLPQGHKIGQKSDCWGHAGCDYTYSEEEVAQEQKTRMEAINSCKNAMDELHLEVSPK
jgi:hypothetical protein